MGIGITRPDGEILDVNPAACSITGYSREELVDMNVAALYVDLDQRNALKKALEETEAVQDREVRVRRKDGEEIICEFSLSRHSSPEDEGVTYQTFIRDVTARVRGERQLAESEEMFRALSENSLVGVKLVQEGRYVYVNPAFARIFGYSPEELEGRPVEELFDPGDWSTVKDRLQECLEGRVPEVHYEVPARTKEGERRNIEIFDSRIIYHGTPALIGTVVDITERRRLQREVLRVQEEERWRLGRDLHDGVSPQLSGIAMMLGALRRHPAVTDDVSRQLREIQGLVQESNEDVQRLSRGLSPVSLSKKGLTGALQRLALYTQGCRFESDTDLPTLQVDEEAHLYWIAQEAVMNARTHGKAREIVIRLTRDDGNFVLIVEDDGTGFDISKVGPEAIGLQSMKYRAELLGAEFSIDSSPGEGTRVSCRLSV